MKLFLFINDKKSPFKSNNPFDVYNYYHDSEEDKENEEDDDFTESEEEIDDQY